MIYNLLNYCTFLSKPHGQEMTVPIKILILDYWRCLWYLD
jgi:hypothetical protein